MVSELQSGSVLLKMSKEGASTTRPPLFDGSDYGNWKTRMRTFIMSLGEDAWGSIEEQWKQPTRSVPPSPGSNDPATTRPATRSELTQSERAAKQGNFIALNAIFGAMDSSQYRTISNCMTAYDAWKALEIAHEGTTDVRATMLQWIESMFDNIHMNEDESITDYHGRFKDLVNQDFALGLVWMKVVKLERC